VRRAHKYGAVATVVDNVRFSSKAEASRYQELRLLERAGLIRDLELQPVFELLAPTRGVPSRLRVGEYRADFRYRDGPDGILRIEDVKGVATALYRWKKRHCELQYGITITEITNGRRR
jgi:hypothetical protein